MDGVKLMGALWGVDGSLTGVRDDNWAEFRDDTERIFAILIIYHLSP